MDFNATNQTTERPTYSVQKKYIEGAANVANFSYSLVASLLAINIVMLTMTVVGNLTVILTVIAYKQLWIPTNILVASLAVVDFIGGVVLQSSNALNLSRVLALATTKCLTNVCLRLLDMTGVMLITASLANLLLITLDRYIAIVYPLRYEVIMTISRTRKAIIFVWVSSLVFGILLSVSSPVIDEIRGILFIYMLLTCVIMISIYCKLYAISRKHAKRIEVETQSFNSGVETKAERRGLTTVAIVTVTMILCYLPIILWEIKEKVAPEERGETARLVCDIVQQLAFIFLLFNSALNPLVYFFRSQRLRGYSRKMIKSMSRRIREYVRLGNLNDKTRLRMSFGT